MQYGLYPFTWDATLGCHRPPDGAMCCIDLRPLSEQAKQGQSSGWGFFSWNGSGAPPSDIIDLGAGDCRLLQPTTAQRDNLRIKLGLASNPSGAFLVDVIGDILGPLSDPTGTSGPKPLMPLPDGTLEIQLASHSRVWSASYDKAATLAAVPTGRASRIRDVIRGQLQQAFTDGGKSLVAKMLGDLLLRHGHQRGEVQTGAPAKRGEWVRLLPPGLIAQLGGGAFAPTLPATTYSDDFNRASIGANWTGVSGTPSITSNQLTGGGVTTLMFRYESDVSSVDHYSQMDVLTSGGASNYRRYYPGVRLSSSAATGYGGASSLGGEILSKWVSGSRTDLTTAASSATSFPYTYKTEISGSTLTLYRGGSSIRSVTDTAISTGTRGGVLADLQSTTGHSGDNWSVTDLTSGATLNLLALMGVGT